MNTNPMSQPRRALAHHVRQARQQALRRLGLCIVLGLICAMLGACGGGDPEDDERPCVIDGKTYQPAVCR
jgi:hypothetical protein